MPKHPSTVVILDQASGYLQIDMLEAYATKYTHRAIIAGTIVERSHPLPAEVTWHKIIPYKRSTAIKRMSTWGWAFLQMLFIVAFKHRKSHVVAITNPPISIFVPWLLRCSYDIVIYDIYPDALAQYNHLDEKSIIYRIWARMNKAAFSKARSVFTLTKGMRNLALQYTSNEDKIKIVPLWSDSSDFNYIEKVDNLILKQTQSNGKFVLLYSGNLGATHPIEKIIEIGEHLNPEEYAVIIIGEGAKKRKLEKMIADKSFTHIHLLPWQPATLFSHNLYAADISIVTLDKQASDLSIPSKTFNILSVGNPILAICEKDSALGNLIEEYEMGYVSDESDIQSALTFIQRVKDDPSYRDKIRNNSKLASESFTKRNALLYLD